MCTLTIFEQHSKRYIAMNRDDLRSRGAEYPPKIFGEETRFLAPTDSDAGGSWIGVNEYRIVAALLNAYDSEILPKEVSRSRGEIVTQALSFSTISEIERWLTETLEIDRYNDFQLVLLQGDEIKAFHKISDSIQRVSLHEYKGCHWLTSSSVLREQVLPFRQKSFKAWVDNGQKLRNGFPSYHLEKDCEYPELATNADREDSHTKSTTQICITEETIEMSYLPIGTDTTPTLSAL